MSDIAGADTEHEHYVCCADYRAARQDEEQYGEWRIVRAGSGGVLPDGTTNHTPIDFAAVQGRAQARDTGGLRQLILDFASRRRLQWSDDDIADLALALSQGAAHEERRLDVEWFVREVIAYYKLYDHSEVWNERGARSLGKWLAVRLATPAPTTEETT